jgi:protein-tyrosine phosphatase
MSEGGFLRPSGRPGLSEITERLLVGEFPRPGDADWLRAERGVDAVICLQDRADLEAKQIVWTHLVAAYERSGIELHHFPVADGDPAALAARLIAIVDRLHALLESGRRVLVHCNGGYNRAPTVAIAYLCRHGGLSLAESRRRVRERRTCAPYMRALESALGGFTR